MTKHQDKFFHSMSSKKTRNNWPFKKGDSMAKIKMTDHKARKVVKALKGLLGTLEKLQEGLGGKKHGVARKSSRVKGASQA